MKSVVGAVSLLLMCLTLTAKASAGCSNIDVEVMANDACTKIETYKSSGQIGSGAGVKAGTAYKMADGSIVYIPENGEGN